MFNKADWTFEKTLAKGSFGEIAVLKKDDQRIAYKTFNFGFDCDAVREIAVHSLLGSHLGFTPVSIAMKLANGNLCDYSHLLSIDDRIKVFPVIIEEAMKKLAILHTMDIIHADIKAENILCWWDDDLNLLSLELADFGLSSSRPDKDEWVYTYKPPEKGHATKKSDIWALGFAFLQFASKLNHISPTSLDRLKKFKESTLVKSMLNKNPDARPVLQTIKIPLPKRIWPDTKRFKIAYYTILDFVDTDLVERDQYEISHAMDILLRSNPKSRLRMFSLLALIIARKWSFKDVPSYKSIGLYLSRDNETVKPKFMMKKLQKHEKWIIIRLAGLIFLPELPSIVL